MEAASAAADGQESELIKVPWMSGEPIATESLGGTVDHGR
jgi:hypothetical protein